MDRKVTTVSSNVGALCTLPMLLIVGAFSYLKLNNLIYQRDIYLTSMPQEYFFDDSS